MSDGDGKDLPPGWVPCVLEDVADLVRGIAFPSDAKSLTAGAGMIACLRTKNVQQVVDWSDLWWVSERYVKRLDQIVIRDDILISVANSLELVGKVEHDVVCVNGLDKDGNQRRVINIPAGTVVSCFANAGAVRDRIERLRAL